MTEAPLNPRANREKLTEIAFEQIQVPRFFPQISSLCALYCEGITSGLILESGEGISTCVPVVEGYIQTHAI